MCYLAVDWVLEHAEELPIRSSGEYIVLIALAKRANPTSRIAWPTISDLCQLAHITERVVQGHLKTLVEDGVITIEYGRGGRQTNHYSIVGWTGAIDSGAAHSTAIDSGAEVLPIAPGGAAHSTAGVLPIAPKHEVKEKEREDKENTPPISPPQPVSPTSLRDVVSVDADEFEVMWQDFWTSYPAKGRRDKGDVKQLFMGSGSGNWPRMVIAAKNYAASSVVVDRKMVMRVDAFITSERWEAYEGEPIIDAPVVNGGYVNGPNKPTGQQPGRDKTARTTDALEWSYRERQNRHNPEHDT